MKNRTASTAWLDFAKRFGSGSGHGPLSWSPGLGMIVSGLRLLQVIQHALLQLPDAVGHASAHVRAHAELAHGRRIDGNAEHVIRPAPDHQLRHHGYPQPAADHSDDRFIIDPGELRIQLDADGLERGHHIDVEPAVGHEELLTGELLQRKRAAVLQGIVPGQNGVHALLVKGHPIAAAVVLPAGKDHVGLPALQQLKGLKGVVHHAQIHIHLRAHAAEPVENLRHPVHGDARIGGDADDLVLLFRDCPDLAFQIGACLQKLPDGRHQLRALLRELYAAVIALQQRKADFPLQRIHHVRQARLGIANALGGPGKTAHFRRRHQNFKFLAVHAVQSAPVLYDVLSYPYYKQAFLRLQSP